MSDLVYRRLMNGGVASELWIGPPFCGVNDQVRTNALGNLMHPNLGGDLIIKRIPVKEEHVGLGITKLTELYPLTQEEINGFEARRSALGRDREGHAGAKASGQAGVHKG